jgi:hypothetical protein
MIIGSLPATEVTQAQFFDRLRELAQDLLAFGEALMVSLILYLPSPMSGVWPVRGAIS